VKGSIRIYPKWKKDTAASETQICWLITAGHLYGETPTEEYEKKDDKMRW
jgi:hypothetical protein